MSAALDRSEAGRLAACEARIERGLATFVDVGQALLEVRDGRLYRAEHGTFEGYCRERWGMSRQRAGQLIDASEVVGAMTTTVDTPVGEMGTTVPTPPSSERVARELAPLRSDPPRLREAWSEAVQEHGPEPTAAEVREVARRKDSERKERGEERRAVLDEQDAAAAVAPVASLLHHGDCFDLIPRLEAGSVKLVLTDPPYGIEYRSRFRWSSEPPRIRGDIEGARDVTRDALQALDAALAPDAHAVVFCRFREEEELRHALDGVGGLRLRGGLVWVKPEGGMGDLARTFAPAHERMLHLARDSARMRRRLPDAFAASRAGVQHHPTEKPLTVLEGIVRALTEPGDLVVDPFAGSGSTLIAAAAAGRAAWGCEIDEAHYRTAEARLAA